MWENSWSVSYIANGIRIIVQNYCAFILIAPWNGVFLGAVQTVTLYTRTADALKVSLKQWVIYLPILSGTG